MWPVYYIYACLLFPLPLLAIAWSKSNRLPFEFSVLTLSGILFLSVTIRSLKLTLLGSDYSHRLFTTIGVNLLIAIILGIYLWVKERWPAAIAAIILAFGWFSVWLINSVV
jgi:hypothetical protein